MRRLSVLVFLGSFAIAGFAVLAPACQQQLEGQQCSLQNTDATGTNLDCSPGLACVQFNGATPVCCPPAGATNPACIPGALPNPDGGTTTTTTGVTTSASTASSSAATGSGGGGSSATSTSTATGAGGGGGGDAGQ
jgi:hypothetical protein